MELAYRKNDNRQLVRDLANEPCLQLHSVQNYVPIYERFFALSDATFNSINLDSRHTIRHVLRADTPNLCLAVVQDRDSTEQVREVFMKLSPLLDPIKYMSGKYDTDGPALLTLPGRGRESSAKAADPNNAAYVDALANHLVSQLLHRHGFINGIDCYGLFLGVQPRLHVDVRDDIDYLCDSKFFRENQGTLFTLSSEFRDSLVNYDTRCYKKRVSIGEDAHPLLDVESLSPTSGAEGGIACSPEVLFEVADDDARPRSLSTSSCSSRSSYTDPDSPASCDSEAISECSTATDDVVGAVLHSFPVQVMALERCDQTLDSLLARDALSDRELTSMVAQVTFSLIVLQRTLSLTHNDLHTNNIMCIRTDKKYIVYKFAGSHYKVPTFGRIYKIIDFGRAIYRVRGVVVCSDSFHPKGDAATQYNCEPYLDDKRPRIEPNRSFDLCRLGCSMYDFLVEDVADEMRGLSEIEQLIVKWCHDDKGRNIMYKSSGQERYPEFKLYKMIARSVHGHTPESVIRDRLFSCYIVGKKATKRCGTVIDVDAYPSYAD
jgi:hypothetical protein